MGEEKNMKFIKKFLFIEENKIKREEKLWNAVFYIFSAMQSVLVLFFVVRLCGEEEGGIISIAFSIAYLMVIIGNYGVRNYQITDVKSKFSFMDYLVHRVVTCIIMMICSYFYIQVQGYSKEKSRIIFLLCVLKMLEAIEDVFYGAYQRNNRLDIASKIGTMRYLFCMAGFIFVLFTTNNLLYAMIGMIFCFVISFSFFIYYTFPIIQIKKKIFNWKNCKDIFIVCFPLFLCNFLNIYIINSSKYSIDKYLTDTIQSYFNMISMPLFVISLLSSCIYQPYLVQLSELWDENNKKQVVQFIFKQVWLIIGICSAVVFLGTILGIPVLTIFYGTDLKPYHTEFLILLCGGGMSAMVGFLNSIITVIREQKSMVWIYSIVFTLAAIIADNFVQQWGIFGATISYVCLLFIQAVIMLFFVLFKLKENK